MVLVCLNFQLWKDFVILIAFFKSQNQFFRDTKEMRTSQNQVLLWPHQQPPLPRFPLITLQENVIQTSCLIKGFEGGGGVKQQVILGI